MSNRRESSSESTNLIRFFDPSAKGRDPCGRSLPHILSWSNEDLEYSHDYIQNVFPLPEGSAFNVSVWLVTPEVIVAFKERAELQRTFGQAFERICSFYGLEVQYTSEEAGSNQEITVLRGQNFEKAKQGWVTRFNHNHLRITRILRSLRVLGLSAHANAFHEFLNNDEEVLRKVSARSRMYWARAAQRPLHLPPDEEDETAEGIAWLRGE